MMKCSECGKKIKCPDCDKDKKSDMMSEKEMKKSALLKALKNGK